MKAITHDGIEFSSDARSVKIIKEITETYALGELYPNPSNNKIGLDLDLPEKTALKLTVYNILGQRVKKMETGKISAGYQRLNIDIGDLSTGVYILFVNSLLIKLINSQF